MSTVDKQILEIDIELHRLSQIDLQSWREEESYESYLSRVLYVWTQRIVCRGDMARSLAERSRSLYDRCRQVPLLRIFSPTLLMFGCVLIYIKMESEYTFRISRLPLEDRDKQLLRNIEICIIRYYWRYL